MPKTLSKLTANKQSKAIMFRITRFCLATFMSLALLPTALGAAKSGQPAVKVKKLLFLEFYNESQEESLRWMQKSMSDSLHQFAQKKYTYQRIADKAWQDYAARNKYQAGDFYNKEKVATMAKNLGADGVIMGKFKVNRQQQKVQLASRILSVVDQEIIAEQKVESPLTTEMFAVTAQVSTTLGRRIRDLFFPTDGGAIFRSAILPGWGQLYKQRKTAGYIWGGAFIGASAFTATSFTLLLVSVIQYENYQPDHVTSSTGETALVDEAATRAEFSRMQGNIDRYKQFSLVGAGIMAGIYLINLLDAWYFDGDYGVVGAPSVKSGAISFQLNQGSPGLATAFRPQQTNFKISYTF